MRLSPVEAMIARIEEQAMLADQDSIPAAICMNLVMKVATAEACEIPYKQFTHIGKTRVMLDPFLPNNVTRLLFGAEEVMKFGCFSFVSGQALECEAQSGANFVRREFAKRIDSG